MLAWPWNGTGFFYYGLVGLTCVLSVPLSKFVAMQCKSVVSLDEYFGSLKSIRDFCTEGEFPCTIVKENDLIYVHNNSVNRLEQIFLLLTSWLLIEP